VDRDRFLGEIKGARTTIAPGRFAMVVTSKHAIEECFSHDQDIVAFRRKLHVIEMTKANQPFIDEVRIDFDIRTTTLKNNEKWENENPSDQWT
jgi:AAA15 family ATPase/GTPase